MSIDYVQMDMTVSMQKCWGQHSCVSSTFSLGILNGTCCLHTAITVKNSETEVLVN